MYVIGLVNAQAELWGGGGGLGGAFGLAAGCAARDGPSKSVRASQMPSADTRTHIQKLPVLRQRHLAELFIFAPRGSSAILSGVGG